MINLKRNGFIEGAVITTVAIFISKILGMVYVIPFYSIVGEQGGALYGYAYNVYNLFLIVSTAGIPLAISKLTSEYDSLGMVADKEKMYKVARNCILVFAVLSFLLCFIFAPLIAKLIIGDMVGGNTIEDVTFVIRAVSFGLLVVPFLSVIRGYLQGHKYMRAPAISQVIEQFVRVLVIVGGSYFALKVFRLSITETMGIVVFSATAGAIIAYFYLLHIFRKNKEKVFPKNSDASQVSTKEIVKKVITYSIPFIIISISNNIYYNINMVLVIRIMTKLGYDALTTETVSSIFTTWGTKICMIVISIATGIMTSLIPHVVSSYVKGKMDEVNIQFNKSLKAIQLVIVPTALFISLTSGSVWLLFYENTGVGANIIKFTILATILESAYVILMSLFQGLNKSKMIYISILLGIGANTILAVPFMLLFNKLGYDAYYGTIFATYIGYSLALLVSIIYLKKKLGFNLKGSIKLLPKTLFGVLAMVGVSLFISIFFKATDYSRLMQLPILAGYGVILIGIFVLINWKEYKLIIPKKYIDKFTKNKKD